MRTSWAAVVALLVVAVLVMATLSTPTHAQTFDSVITGALANHCARLGGPVNPGQPPVPPFPLLNQSLGPHLGRLCLVPIPPAVGPPTPTVSSSSTMGGSVTVDTNLGATNEAQRVLQRLKEKRDEENQKGAPGASADLPTGIPGLGVFGSGNYENFNKDVTTFEPGYTSNNWGFTTGADYKLNPRLILGAAFNYSQTTGNFNNHGGDFETSSFGPLLYGSVFPIPSLFVDMVAGYARKHYTINRAASAVGDGPGFPPVPLPPGIPLFPSVSGTVESATGGNEDFAGLHTGYDFHLGSVIVGPRGGVDYKYTTIEGFRESGSTGLELVYDNQHQTSLTTTAGAFVAMALSTSIGVFVPQGTFEWVHEFENNQRVIYFRFSEDFARRRFRFQTDPPDRNYANVGGGLVVVWPGGLSAFANYRARVGYSNELVQTVNFGLRVEF